MPHWNPHISRSEQRAIEKRMRGSRRRNGNRHCVPRDRTVRVSDAPYENERTKETSLEFARARTELAAASQN